MWVIIPLVAIPVVLIGIALVYDQIARRRGWHVRDSTEIERESMQDRLDHEPGHDPFAGYRGPAPRDR